MPIELFISFFYSSFSQHEPLFYIIFWSLGQQLPQSNYEEQFSTGDNSPGDVDDIEVVKSIDITDNFLNEESESNDDNGSPIGGNEYLPPNGNGQNDNEASTNGKMFSVVCTVSFFVFYFHGIFPKCLPRFSLVFQTADLILKCI